MPKRLKIESHLSLNEVEQRFHSSQEVTERSHWQVIWLLCQGHPSEEVAQVCGYSVAWVRLLAARYNQGGPQALDDRRRVHPGAPPLVDAALEEELRQAVQGPVPEEVGGGLWSGPKVALWLEQRLERGVARQRGHEALVRVGYSCQSPRPRHAQADSQAQEAFKKHSLIE